MNKKISIIFVVFMCLILTSCLKQFSSFKSDYQDVQLSSDVLNIESCAVAIRYPVMFSSFEAEEHANSIWHECIKNLYSKNISVDISDNQIQKKVSDKPDYASPSKISLIKSHYYAMSLYNQMKKAFPENRVLLCPAIVNYKNNKFEYEYSDLSIPTTIIVDFFVLVDNNVDSDLTTAGTSFFPFISIKTTQIGSKKTEGAILVSTKKDSLCGNPENESLFEADNPFASKGVNLADVLNTKGLINSGAQYNLVDYDNTSSQIYEVSKIDHVVYDLDKISIYKQRKEHYEMTPEDRVMSQFVYIVKNILNKLNYSEIISAQLPYYYKIYDDNLANRVLTNNLLKDDELKILALQEFLKSEIKFQSSISNKAYDMICKNEFGKSIRNMIVDEVKICEKRRSQKVDTAFAVFTGLLAAATATSVVASGASQVNTQQLQFFLEQSMDVIGKDIEGISKSSEEINQTTSLYESISRDMYADSVTVGSHQVRIESSNTSDLRSQYKKLYLNFVSNMK